MRKDKSLFDTKTDPSDKNLISYKKLKNIKCSLIWDKLGDISLKHIIEYWVSCLNENTARSYLISLRSLDKINLISLEISLQQFALVNHNFIIDSIKNSNLTSIWSEGTKQVRAACYISLTKFLNRLTEGVFPVALPSSLESNKTFFKIRDVVKTHAMDKTQWPVFLQNLKDVNYRDWLIAQTILQGGKRVNEVLNLQIKDINFSTCEILFKQTKTKGLVKETIITYPAHFINMLKEHIFSRENFNDLVFVSKKFKKISLKQLANTFAKAGKLSHIPFKITPHVLRATAVTAFKSMGCSDSDIMKVTGHSSSKMIYAYDKSNRSENASKKVVLI